MMRFFVLIFAVIGLIGAGPQSASAQEKTAVQKGFELAPNSGKRILVFRPAIRVGAQSTAGLFEPNADWTEEATKNIQASLAEFQERIGNEVINAPEAYGAEAQNLQEHMDLFAAVSRSAIKYQFFAGQRLPTKKKDNREDIFDWSLGSGVSSLPGADGADYGLFIFNKDAYGSTGRKLLQGLAFLARVPVKSGISCKGAGKVWRASRVCRPG